ncbi:MAG: lipoyl(octanoyl) transferase LipB [Duodenibacillus sp.]|nr:lipoyl(octanoyl) transferase LipB [Duodenibacillus sp.]
MLIRYLGTTAYGGVYSAMQAFTRERGQASADELWITEHLPVFTAGRRAERTDAAAIAGIPVIPVDRGGDVTYHGPGQIVAYPMLDIQRSGVRIKELVARLEDALIATLADYGIGGFRHPGAPGVYAAVAGGAGEFAGLAKIASIGIKVSRGCSYHGVSLNARMDLSPFSMISPCGYRQLRMTSMERFVPNIDACGCMMTLAGRIAERFA